ncbi:MAG: LuxR C-terminal-related transcriptional regulator [Muribaculaceae bacterium]|nr:LuxR C-terminal-related transcriptional regulator [Muribaculaceae bacterium]
MEILQKLDKTLRLQAPKGEADSIDSIMNYAETTARLENCIVVISDMRNRRSHIFSGKFADEIGLSGYKSEDSIWEHQLLSLMSDEAREEKYLGELRFYNYVRLKPREKRTRYFLAMNIVFTAPDGSRINVVHRMNYIYDSATGDIHFALCRYERQWCEIPGRCVAVDSLTGKVEELTSQSDRGILSKRETQILALIDKGMMSKDIAAQLSISKNTVSRHRQEILAKLQVKNSLEACRSAKRLGLL